MISIQSSFLFAAPPCSIVLSTLTDLIIHYADVYYDKQEVFRREAGW
jgi:hypothetical protein